MPLGRRRREREREERQGHHHHCRVNSRLPPNREPRRDEVRVRVPGQQACLEEQHARRPDRWRSPEKREHHLREHRLNEEQQQGADEERRREDDDDRHVRCDYRSNQAWSHPTSPWRCVEGASSAPLTTARVSPVYGRLSSNRRVPKGMTASGTGTKRRADTVLAGRDTLTRQHRIRDRHRTDP